MGYCTVAQVRAEYTTMKTDEELQVIIDAMSDWIDRLTQDHFGKKTLTLYCNGSRSPVLWLGKYTELRCLSVTSLTDVEYGTEYASDCYKVFEHEIVLEEYPEIRATTFLGEVEFPKGYKNIKVVGEFGWSETPERITRACVLMVIDVCEGRGASRLLSSESIGDYSYSVDTAVGPPHDLKLFTGNLEVDMILSEYYNDSLQLYDTGGYRV